MVCVAARGLVGVPDRATSKVRAGGRAEPQWCGGAR
jgi:hypothetical protein